MILRYEQSVPPSPREGAPLIVLLHGRGSDRHDLMGLRQALPDHAIVVTPEAPFPGAPWGYGPGWAWYRYLGADRPEPESFEESQQKLGEFLREYREQLPVRPGPLVLGGFSQGGTMSVAHALRHPGEVPLALNFSGFLPAHPSVEATPGTVAGTSFFWGHGTADPNIPHAMAEAGRSVLRAAGARLEARDYPIGHWIDPDELRDAAAWLDATLGEMGPGGSGKDGER
jgi:phospholipase/carboxylesterase